MSVKMTLGNAEFDVHPHDVARLENQGFKRIDAASKQVKKTAKAAKKTTGKGE